MRQALAGLTTRGRSFLAAGAAAVACALLLGQPDLLRVGALLVTLPLLCVLAVWRTQYKLAGTRAITPSRAPVGADVVVSVSLENLSALPTGVLLVEDAVPYALGSRPRFVLARLEPRGRRELSYRVRSDVRGRFRLGPLALRVADPFGMCELSRSFTSRDTLTVIPRVRELPRLSHGGEWSGRGDSHARSVTAAGDDDVATREYRHGDDLRRVHWRSTAKLGELMVRREEQPWQSRATLLLDTRACAYPGERGGAAFEWAVAAAASVGAHLSRHGYSVRLVTDGGPVGAAENAGGRVGPDFEGLLLDALAVVNRSAERSLAAAAATLRRGPEDLLVALLGTLTVEQASRLAQARHGAASAVCLMLDGAAPAEPAAAVLRRAGWVVVPTSVADDVAVVWRRAGSGGGAAPADPLAPAGAGELGRSSP